MNKRILPEQSASRDEWIQYAKEMEETITTQRRLIEDVWYPIENYANQVLDDDVVERVLNYLHFKALKK